VLFQFKTLNLKRQFLSASFIFLKNKLQVLIGHLMFLHKAIRPARVFVNRILALLRKMGNTNRAAIDEDTKRDLQWFTVCAHVIYGTVFIYKCLHPRIDIFVDASLNCLGVGT
jgi:hypothetical protein